MSILVAGVLVYRRISPNPCTCHTMQKLATCVIAQVTNRLQDCRSMLKILPVAAGENPNFKTTSVNPALILRWFEMIKILLNTFELLFSLFSLNGMV